MAYENFDYDFQTNGESKILNKLKSCTENINTIFDVGANRGTWSLMTAKLFDNVTIYSFEIVPETYSRLSSNCKKNKNIITNNIGLSNSIGKTKVFYSPEKSGCATCIKDFTEDYHNYVPQEIEASISKGDKFCSEHNIQSIDYLKIDVEGYENNVLYGFEGMLNKGKIKIIQFEYGQVNIKTHFLLKDFYDYLEKFDMVIGKIYPNYVDFRKYKYTDENFLGPNYLAVHCSCENVIELLKN